jgi:murein DD-endopeptidase MepM/ murein hydrolase activator NlpD
LSELDVETDDEVSKGDQIGISGDEGTGAEGDHLHFEIWTTSNTGPSYPRSRSDLDARFRNPVDEISSLSSAFEGNLDAYSVGDLISSAQYPECDATIC